MKNVISRCHKALKLPLELRNFGIMKVADHSLSDIKDVINTFGQNVFSPLKYFSTMYNYELCAFFLATSALLFYDSTFSELGNIATRLQTKEKTTQQATFTSQFHMETMEYECKVRLM